MRRMKQSTVMILLLIPMALSSATALSLQAAVPETGIEQEEQEANRERIDAKKVTEKPGYGEAFEKVPMLEKAVDPDLYVLGPYDRLLINLMGPEPRTYHLPVLPEGYVFLPGVGAIHADGLTLSEFRRRLSKKVYEYFRNIELYCYLEVPRVFRVFVTGEVELPGAVEVSAVERVSDAIERAGGITDRGSTRLVTLERVAEVLRVDLLRFRLEGDIELNPFLQSGDRIHVPPRGWDVKIPDRVKRPGHYEIIPGETIGDLIDLAGGLTKEALEDSILLNRVDESGNVSTFYVPFDRLDHKLQDLDEVNLFDAVTERRRVYVYGAVKGTGRYYLAPDEGLAELLIRVGTFEELADLDAAYIEKKNGELITVNVRDYTVPGQGKNLPLMDGDVLFIPWIQNTVTVGGLVQQPGKFTYMNDWPVIKYIGLAGGPTEEGSVNRIEIYSLDGSSRKAGKDSLPKRGDVIIVKKSKAKLFGEFFSGLIRLGTVVISIIVLTK